MIQPGVLPPVPLGHASPTTTATYTHIANCGLHDAVARLAETLVDWLDHQR